MGLLGAQAAGAWALAINGVAPSVAASAKPVGSGSPFVKGETPRFALVQAYLDRRRQQPDGTSNLRDCGEWVGHHPENKVSLQEWVGDRPENKVSLQLST